MKIEPHETFFSGESPFVDGRFVETESARRLRDLLANHLIRIAASADGWDVLYRDPDDGRLWERTCPHSEMHGGGPSELRCLSRSDAVAKYGEVVPPGAAD